MKSIVSLKNIDKNDVFLILSSTKNSRLKEEGLFSILFPDLYRELSTIKFPEGFSFPQKIYHFLQNDFDLSMGLCKCGKRCRFISFIKGYVKHCSKECAMNDVETKEKYKKTCLDLYGVDNYSKLEECNQLKIKTCNERYGVDNVFQCDDVKEKRKKTLLNRFGVDSPMKNDICKNKYKKTSRDRYGNDFYIKTDEGKINYKEVCLKKYGSDWYSKSDEYKERHDEIQEKINKSKRNNNTFNSSSIENKIEEYFLDKNVKFIRNYRDMVYPFNCDFYLPDYDLYIEIQGTWTHGKHPFDENNKDDIDKLNLWKSKNSKYYDNAINTWTIRDVKKRKYAKSNKLNFLEIFSCDIKNIVCKIEDRING